MPVLTTLNVAVCPAVTVWLTGWVVIAGAMADAFTVRTAALLVVLPALLGYRDGELRVVVRYDFRRSGVARRGGAADGGGVLVPLVGEGSGAPC